MARKPYITVTLDPATLEYLESKVKDKTFASMSHGVEVCITRYMQSNEKEKERQ